MFEEITIFKFSLFEPKPLGAMMDEHLHKDQNFPNKQGEEDHRTMPLLGCLLLIKDMNDKNYQFFTTLEFHFFSLDCIDFFSCNCMDSPAKGALEIM